MRILSENAPVKLARDYAEALEIAASIEPQVPAKAKRKARAA